MRFMTELIDNETSEHVSGLFGVVRVTSALSKMFLSRKLLMELAGSLYIDHFVLEFSELSIEVISDPAEPFLCAAAKRGIEEICDLPACVGKSVKLGSTLAKISQDGFWWVAPIHSPCVKVRTLVFPWSTVFQVVGDKFDPKEEISKGSFLVNWEEEK